MHSTYTCTYYLHVCAYYLYMYILFFQESQNEWEVQNTYIHTHIHTCMRRFTAVMECDVNKLHTYIHTYIHTYMHNSQQYENEWDAHNTYIHTCIHACIHDSQESENE